MMRKTIGAALVAAFLAAPAAVRAQAQPKPADAGAPAGADIEDVNLHDLTMVVQRITGKTFLWPEEVGLRNKRVHFVSDKPVVDNPDLLFKAYQSILQVSGFALVPVGGDDDKIYKVFPIASAPKQPTAIQRSIDAPMDSFVTRVFILQHVNPQNVQAALINLASFPQAILTIPDAGLLLVTDYDYNIQRFEAIIKEMDVKKPDVEMKLIPLKNAIATEVETMLNGLLDALIQRSSGGVTRNPRLPRAPGVPGGAGSQESVKIVADQRTNSVILLAEPARLPQLEDIVRRLDSETPFETSGIYVVHLRNTNARDIEDTLVRMYGGFSRRPRTGGVAPPSPPGTSPVSRPASPISRSVGGYSAATAEGAPTIVSDERSNSLIVVSDRVTYKTLESVIRRLDQRRPQVLLKATVVEIRAKDTFDLGVELARFEDPANRLIGAGRSQFGQSTIVPDLANNTFAITPIDTPGITLLAMKDRIGNIGGMIKALNENAKVSILDEPEAATNDNGYAQMSVTSQVPVLQTTVTGVGTAQTTFNRFETAETTLTISPHISEGGYLRMETSVKIEKFTRESADPTIPPPKTSREITTNEIMVPNASTMVIGGIVTQDDSDTVTGVPVLMDIPVLGSLFRRTTQIKERRTLYIFLTPYILYDHSFGDFRDVTRERKEDIEARRGAPLEKLHFDAPSEELPRSTFRFHTPDAMKKE